MKALHEFICQKRNNNRKAPGLQADREIPMNATAGMCQKPGQPTLDTNGIGRREAWLQPRCLPTQRCTAEAVNHLYFHNDVYFCCRSTVCGCKKEKTEVFTLREPLHQNTYCILKVLEGALHARVCAHFRVINTAAVLCLDSPFYDPHPPPPTLLLGLYPLAFIFGTKF